MTNKKKKEVHLDAEEKALLDSFEKGEWQSVKKLSAEKSRARQAASSYLRKGTRINIRISETALQQIKQKAAYEGLPYQTLIASLLHKYAAGHS